MRYNMIFDYAAFAVLAVLLAYYFRKRKPPEPHEFNVGFDLHGVSENHGEEYFQQGGYFAHDIV